MSQQINVVLTDDHSIVRNGIKMLLESEDEINVIGEASDGEEAFEVVSELEPDVLIMDISMPKLDGIGATEKITKAGLSTKILILSMYDKEEFVLKAVELGAFGYILKDAPRGEFIKAIKSVAGGEKFYSSDISNIIVERYLNTMGGGNAPAAVQEPVATQEAAAAVPTETYDLTKRERDILTMIVKEGLNNKQISDALKISVRTIETHRFNIMKKLGVNNAADMIRICMDKQVV